MSRAPGKRKRHTQACIPCQSSKRRCSSGLPCSHCIRRNCESSCVYNRDRRRRQPETPSPPISEHRSILAEFESQSPSASQLRSHALQGPQPSFSKPSALYEAQDPAPAQAQVQAAVDSNTPDETLENHISTQPLMLKDSSGNDVFIGNTATIAFLPLVRDIIRRRTGPSLFTEHNYSNTMLETELQPMNSTCLQNNTCLSQKRELVDMFFAASSGVLDIFDHAVIMQTLEAAEQGQQLEESQRIQIELVLAIGATCHSGNHANMQGERTHLDPSRMLVTLQLLDTVTLDTVRIFLLSAFYMLCVCRRNTGYMYLGIAARVGHMLGLHCDALHVSKAKDRSLRLKIWKSLYVLDFLVSSLVGRPAAVSSPASGLVSSAEDDGFLNKSSLALDATYSLFVTMDSLFRSINKEKGVNSNSAKIILQRLKDWSAEMDPRLRTVSSLDESRALDQNFVIGNVHLVCFYYYTVLIIARPYLVHHLLSEERLEPEQGKEDAPSVPQSMASSTKAVISELANTCVDGAIFLLETCHESLQKDFLVDNMCLLQAVIFPAALVVGLAMFMNEESDITMTSAFENAIDVLQNFSSKSQQANRYRDILENLRADINKRRNQILTRKRELSTRPVRKMFHLGMPNENGAISQAADTLFEEPLVENLESGLVSNISVTGWDDPAAALNFGDFVFGSWEGCQPFLQG